MTRILRVKYELDLFNDPFGNPDYSEFVGDPNIEKLLEKQLKEYGTPLKTIQMFYQLMRVRKFI